MMIAVQKEKQEVDNHIVRHDRGEFATAKSRSFPSISARNKKIMKVAFAEFVLALVLACACKCATGFWKEYTERCHNEALNALKTIWGDSKEDYYYSPRRSYDEIEFGAYDPRRYYELLCRKIENLKDSWSETLSRPFRRIDRAVVNAKERFPEYMESSLEMFVARLADGCLHWIVFCFIVLKTMIWIVAKFINGWVDGPLIGGKSLAAVMLDNGDIVIHLDH